MHVHGVYEIKFGVRDEFLQCEKYFRYAVDGFWRHDPEIAFIKNEFGHFNNVIQIDNLPDVQKIKVPRPKSASRNRRMSGGDDTLVLSGVEDVLSLNDTLVLSEDNNTFDDGINSDDDDDQV